MSKNEKDHIPSIRSELKRHMFSIIYMAVALILFFVTRLIPNFAEFYAQTVYKGLALIFTFITGLISISIAEFALYGLVITAVVMFILFVIKVIRAGSNWYKRLLAGLFTAVIIFGLFVSSFMVLWGTNYYRPSFAELNNMDAGPFPKSELVSLCEELAAELNELRPLVAEDENGVFKLNEGTAAMLSKTKDGYLAVKEEFPLLRGSYSRPKMVQYSEGMSYLGISGIYIPFTDRKSTRLNSSH